MKQLRRIEIEPSDNGGHTVTSHFKATPAKRSGAMNSGIYMEHSEPEMHTFGPKEHGAVISHISKALGLKSDEAEQRKEQVAAGSKANEDFD